jgi:alkylation response protein AidB-like acyl-CoA dehydrogenase
MDEHGKVRRAVATALRTRRHGNRDSRGFGGSAATFFHSVLAVEALSRVDPSVGVLVDVQNTLVINALLRWGSDETRAALLPQLAATRSAPTRCRKPAPAAMRSR